MVREGCLKCLVRTSKRRSCPLLVLLHVGGHFFCDWNVTIFHFHNSVQKAGFWETTSDSSKWLRLNSKNHVSHSSLPASEPEVQFFGNVSLDAQEIEARQALTLTPEAVQVSLVSLWFIFPLWKPSFLSPRALQVRRVRMGHRLSTTTMKLKEGGCERTGKNDRKLGSNEQGGEPRNFAFQSPRFPPPSSGAGNKKAKTMVRDK